MISKFTDLGISEDVAKAMDDVGWEEPTPIQVATIPQGLEGIDLFGQAQTGTGKTGAYASIVLGRIPAGKKIPSAIVLVPTRELALQVADQFDLLSKYTGHKTVPVYGGSGKKADIDVQIKSLQKGSDIIAGTTGRVRDMIRRGALNLTDIKVLVLDEADRMLDMGFIEDIENIFECANQDCRVLLFSATVPKEILKIAQRFMGEYEIVEEEGFEEEPLLIEQKYWVMRESEKVDALVRLIDISPDFFGLVFVQRKSDADYVSKSLDERGYEAAALHGDIPQGQREKILARFRSKKTRILVATDVAARGIDIEGVTHVVNYELPFDGPTYVHRIGRTGRAGAAGMAVTFVKPEETRRRLNYLINTVKKSSKGEIVEDKVPSIEEVLEAKKSRLFSDIKNKLGLNQEKSESQAESDSVSADENAEANACAEPKVPHLRKGDPVFDKLAEELCNGQNPEEVVASLLAVSYGGMLNKNRYGKINTYSVESKGRDRDRGGRRERDRGSRRGGDAFVGDDQLRLYVQMGWDDGYNPRKIADFFHDLLGVPGRKVDAIDMADKFCLLSLPADDGRRAIELSERDRSLPHMHLDTKVTGGGLGERDSFGRDRGSRRGGRDRGRERDRGFGRDRDFAGRRERDRDRGFRGGSHARAGVHTATQRSGSSSFFKRSDAQEY